MASRSRLPILIVLAAIIIIVVWVVFRYSSRQIAPAEFLSDQGFENKRVISPGNAGLWLFEEDGEAGIYSENDSAIIVPPDFDLVLPTLQPHLFYVVKDSLIGIFNKETQEMFTDSMSRRVGLIWSGQLKDEIFLESESWRLSFDNLPGPDIKWTDELQFIGNDLLYYAHTNISHVSEAISDTVRIKGQPRDVYGLKLKMTLRGTQGSGVYSLKAKSWMIEPAFAVIQWKRDSFLTTRLSETSVGYKVSPELSRRAIIGTGRLRKGDIHTFIADSFKTIRNLTYDESERPLDIAIIYRSYGGAGRRFRGIGNGDTLRFFKDGPLDRCRIFEVSTFGFVPLNVTFDVFKKDKKLKVVETNRFNIDRDNFNFCEGGFEDADLERITMTLFDVKTMSETTRTFYLKPVLPFQFPEGF